MKLPHLLYAAVGLAILGSAIWYLVKGSGVSIEPMPESEVEMTATEAGRTYKINQGNLYRVNPWSKKWDFIKTYYDPDFYEKNYVERDGNVFRKGDQGELVAVGKAFSDDFEGAAKLVDLIGIKRGWAAFTLQSPKAPTVSEYVKLRSRILKGESDFLDNRIETSSEVVHGGNTSLKSVSVPPSRSMVTAKSSLSTELLHFVKGDDVWISIWCRVPPDSGMPFTVLDLETTWIAEHPGIRIVITDGKYVAFQLKAAGHAYYRQPRGKEVLFPKDQWVNLKAHLKLSENDDGLIELWQDGQKNIDTRGQTLVLAHAIYNSLEIGTSAYNEQGKSATLYVDDVSISDRP